MLPVSNDYLTDMAKPIRNFSDVLIMMPLGRAVTIYGNDWNIGLTRSPSVVADFSPVNAITNYAETADTADENGEFVFYPSFGFDFFSPQSISGFSLQFSDAVEYAVRSFRLKITHSDNTTESYDFDIDSSLLANGVYSVLQGFESVSQVDVYIKKANPYSKARVFAVSTRAVFSFDNKLVTSVETVTDIDQISRRLPTETISFSVLDFSGDYDPDNPDGILSHFELKQPFSIQYGYLLDDGTWEWLNKTMYVLDGYPTKDGFNVQFSGTKLLATLTGTYRKGVFNPSGESLYELAKAVLNDAGVSVISGLDASLLSIRTKAPLPVKTHAECLQLIAQAGNCLLFTNSNGVIQLKSGWYPSSLIGDETIDYSTQTEFPKVEITPPLRNEAVKQYRYVQKVASEELASQEFTIAGTEEVWIDYDLSINQSASVSGGALNSAQYYGRCALLTITGSGTVTVTINGNKVAIYSATRELDVNAAGDDDSFDNELITDSVVRSEVAQYRANYLKNRNGYTLEYRGNPELECSDVVGFETQYADGFVGVIAKTSISYNGALSGELVLKKLDSYVDYYYADSELYSGESLGVM